MSFPNGEHADVGLDGGELSIGAAHGNAICLPNAGLAARHVRLRADGQRGIVLNVLDKGAQVHVNARPVREVALLRLGDVVSLNRVQMLIKPGHNESIDPRIPELSAAPLEDGTRTAASRVVLRGVGGSYFGRSIALQQPALVGRAADAAIRVDDADIGERHAQFELHGERVLLRDLGSAAGSVVNGVRVRDAVLHPGDQIAFDGQRFVLEAPGLPPRGTTAMPAAGSGMGTTQTLQAIRVEPGIAAAVGGEAGASPKSHLGWLIVTALMIAAAIVGLLMFAPR